MRILFMGTPEFAVPTLETLVQGGHEVCAVYTQPDKPKGRGYELTPPPVKSCALRYDIPVEQPTTLKDEAAAEHIRALRPELIVVVAYGKILPETVLNIPPFGCVNVHASLLPKYRGAAPIQWAVINGEKKSGVTTMHMAKGIDTGDMIIKEETEIGENETSGELHDRLKIIGAGLLLKTAALLEKGEAPREKQDDSLSTYAPMLEKSLSAVRWEDSARRLHNLCRGLNPWPMAQTTLQGRVIKLRGTLLDETTDTNGAAPGEILHAGDDGIVICCGGGGALRVLELQEQGKRPLTAAEYLRGHKIAPGTVCQ